MSIFPMMDHPALNYHQIIIKVAFFIDKFHNIGYVIIWHLKSGDVNLWLKTPKYQQHNQNFTLATRFHSRLKSERLKALLIKSYTNSFLITFESDDPEIIDKYHKKVVINNRHLKMIKAAPKIKDTDDDKETKSTKSSKKK